MTYGAIDDFYQLDLEFFTKYSLRNQLRLDDLIAIRVVIYQ